jgi:hypothetical protein
LICKVDRKKNISREKRVDFPFSDEQIKPRFSLEKAEFVILWYEEQE